MATCKFYTLGCKTNYYETQLMREGLATCGFKEESCKNSPVDIFVVNTCTVTQKADRESRAVLRRALRQNPNAVVVAAGCYAEAERDEIREIIGEKGIIVGNKDKDNLCSLLGYKQRPSVTSHQSPVTSFQSISYSGISDFANRTRAFVKIQDGCNNRCSYCKIPYVRGLSRSRPLDEIVSEIERLAKNGFKEVVLTGICIGAYRDNSYNLTDVIERIDDIEGLARIRLSSIEPKDIKEQLINAIANSKKICHHLHIPFQSADDKILRRMHRDYTLSDYLCLIDMVRERISDAVITTDIIAGFPGEDETAFENTMIFLKRLKPIKVHIFPFSPRQATPAYYYGDRVPPFIIAKRIKRLQTIAEDIRLVYMSQLIDKSVEVLIESNKINRYFSGYTDTYIKVMASADSEICLNTLQNVRIERMHNNCLIGRII